MSAAPITPRERAVARAAYAQALVDGQFCDEAQAVFRASVAITEPETETPRISEFDTLLKAWEDAVRRNGYIAGIDSTSQWHEEEGVDEEVPRKALLDYLHAVEARGDPAGDVQRIASLEEQVAGLSNALAARSAPAPEDGEGERLRDGNALHDGAIYDPANCPRGRSDCAPPRRRPDEAGGRRHEHCRRDERAPG